MEPAVRLHPGKLERPIEFCNILLLYGRNFLILLEE